MSDGTGLQITSCPACHGTNAPAIGREATGFDTVFGTEHFYQPAYWVRGCETCGLYFKSAILSADRLDSFYAALDGQTFDIDGNFPTDRVLHQRLRALPAGSRVLDFGCSTGRILKDHAARLTCVGVEPNEPAAATARSRGIAIVAAEELWSGHQLFDAILLADVYEHLLEPVLLLQRLAGRLAPGGWLAIVTGNADAIETRSRLAEFWYFRMPGHLIMLSERHLPWLSQQLGLRLDAVHRCSHYDVAFARRLRQRVQAFAYDVFQTSPNGAWARVLRALPRLSAAASWSTAPALDYRADHVVAFFSRPQEQR